MPARLGQSWYLPQYKEEGLPDHIAAGSLLFTSAHIQEEQTLFHLLKDLIQKAHERSIQVVVDVDDQTPAAYGCRDLMEFKERFQPDMLRLDDGFDLQEIQQLAKCMPVALNASTLPPGQKQDLVNTFPDLLFIHNFYPRPETGLDVKTFTRMNDNIPARNLAVFIPGDTLLRGPLYMGLPTLEAHRSQPPYVSWVQFRKMGLENILLADPGLSAQQRELIDAYEEGILTLPCIGLSEDLKNRELTIRLDSPAGLKRFAGTRAYGKPGEKIHPYNTVERTAGSLCQDNELYGRYSGEIMLAIADYPQDEKVNVIAHVAEAYLPLLGKIENSDRIRLVEWTA